MAEVARKARVSRQALYLHFADRAELFTAAVRDADEQRGLSAAIREVVDAPTGIDGVIEMVALQARMNPGNLAHRAGVRSSPPAGRGRRARPGRTGSTSVWRGAATMVDRLAREGTLRPGLDRDVAADLLWTLTSLRMWEDLVLQRKWSAREYERRLGEVLLTTLTNTAASILQRR